MRRRIVGYVSHLLRLGPSRFPWCRRPAPGKSRGAKKQLLLVSLLNNPRPTKEARDIAKSEQMIEITSGMAMIVDNMINRFLGNLFIAMNKGEYPVRLFKNESQATVWLRSLKN